MATNLRLPINFGVRDQARFKELIDVLSQIPQGFRNQVSKELMLEGLRSNKDIISRYLDIPPTNNDNGENISKEVKTDKQKRPNVSSAMLNNLDL